MPRLFTGLEVPAQCGTALALTQGGLPGARWIDPEFFHITLRFIGDIDDSLADEVVDVLSRVHRAPFTVSLSGMGAFGSRKPHAVWAGIERSPELKDLQAQHERMMQRLGLAPNGRKYTPHITLARLRGTSAGAVAQWLADRGDFRLGPIQVERFVLFSARASRGGGPYLIEEAFPLAA